uniref:Protein kinase domain-containing protein n=1 Tax=Heterorhabditis bacteriophora TaxID=37862 RepID=A0A1I7WUE9_HETBA
MVKTKTTTKTTATIFQPTANKSQSNSLPNRAQRHNKPIQPPSPVELVIPQPTSSHSPEVAVTETIVLPRKTDKLDFTSRFTRTSMSTRWAAVRQKLPLLIRVTRKKNQKRPMVVPNQSQSKNQLLFGRSHLDLSHYMGYQDVVMEMGSSYFLFIIRHFPIDLDAPKLPRVASFDHVPDRKMDVQNGNWRAGSQANPRINESHNKNKYHQHTPPKDPTLAIDQLVAELELNTDQVITLHCIVVNDFNTTQVIQQRKKHPSHILYATPHSTSQSNPFETINQEKINPSRVEAIHNMFERGAGLHMISNDIYIYILILYIILQLLIPVRRSSIVGRQSISSRAQSLEDDDDGFYDNVGVFDDRRFSRGSEMDVTSFSSRQLPPTGAKQNKIGSFFRKIGASRPPGSAASLISLNKEVIYKVANETPIKSGALMKSNSLSTEPWKKHVLERQNVSNRESRPLPAREAVLHYLPRTAKHSPD